MSENFNLQWIPVSEALPDHPMRCLVYTMRGKEGGYDITTYNRGFYCGKDVVTHWMPLPPEPVETVKSETVSYEKRPMKEEERKYASLDNSTQIRMQCGLIGFLRADMDADGNSFFSNWEDYKKELKADKFKTEFDHVINSLRREGNILHNRKDLAYFCYTNPFSKMQNGTNDYGVRVDTEKYSYLLRLNPDKEDYNLCCFCYVREWLNNHIHDAQEGIRFISSNYETLFSIPDGGKIVETYRDGTCAIKTCRYIDAYHVEIGDNLYHICQYAEMCERGHVTCSECKEET